MKNAKTADQLEKLVHAAKWMRNAVHDFNTLVNPLPKLL